METIIASAPVITDSTGQEILTALKNSSHDIVTTKKAGFLAPNANIKNGYIQPATAEYNGLMTWKQYGQLQKEIFFETEMTQNAAYRNGAPLRSKYLGDSITDEQLEAIANRTYEGLWLDDYWKINGTFWCIVDFEPYYNCGDTALTQGHIAVIPKTSLAAAKWNTSENDTSMGYVASDARIVSIRGKVSGTEDDVTSKGGVQGKFIAAFGDEHVLTYRAIYPSAYTDGVATAWAWVDARVELMNEMEVFGTGNFGSSGYEIGISHRQFAAFAKYPTQANIRGTYHLRTVWDAKKAGAVGTYGDAGAFDVTDQRGIRPFALIG